MFSKEYQRYCEDAFSTFISFVATFVTSAVIEKYIVMMENHHEKSSCTTQMETLWSKERATWKDIMWILLVIKELSEELISEMKL